MRTLARMAAITLFCASGAGAQDAATEQPVTPRTKLFARIERVVIAIHSIFGRPLHPVVSTVAPGGGWGGGLGYDSPGRGPWNFSANGVWTLNNYKLGEAVAGYSGRRAEFEAFGRYRDMTRLDYFGLGNSSNLFDRTNFRLKDPVAGAHGRFRLASWVALGGRVEQLWPEASAGKHPSIPSIDQRFTSAEAPGLFVEEPAFGRYQASVDLHLPAAAGDALYQGTRSRVTYAFYDDQDAELFNFRRLDIELQQVLAGIGAHHRLTLSGWMSTSMMDEGQDVPFYLQRSLGGRTELRSVHDQRLGSDGTQATLRGYRDLRFRDRHLLLYQAEYRVPVWGPIDATVFAEAGKVTRGRDIGFGGLRRDFGFSLSAMKGWVTAARVDVGFGSGEGTRVFLGLGEMTP